MTTYISTNPSAAKQMKGRRLVAIVVAVCLLGWLVIHLARTREPSYEGRTLTEWLATGEKGEWLEPSSPHAYGFVEKSCAPIQAIGKKGIPTLLGLLKAHDSKTKAHDPKPRRFFVSLHDRQTLDHLQSLPDWFKQEMGVRGFTILGKDGISAVPELIKLLDDVTGDTGDNSVSFAASQALEQLLSSARKDKAICLPALRTVLNDSDGEWPLLAANRITAWFPEEAEKAGVYKKFPQLKPSSTNNVQTNAPAAK